jgi:transcription elongation factor GreA
LEKEFLLTEQGLAELKAEIEELSTVTRAEIAERIKEAREFGDISENAEYDAAKNEQAMVEAKIASLEHRLRNSRVIEEDEVRADQVSIGSIVILKDVEFKETDEYRIVGSAEADPSRNRLSNESPVGRAIMGRHVGEKVQVPVPKGTATYQIIEIKSA